MIVLIGLASALAAGQPAPDPDNPAAAAPPSIDSLLAPPPLPAPISEEAREAAVRAAFAAAQSRRGALDGRWRLTGSEGQALYIFELSDSGAAPDPRSSQTAVPVIEGAWRDPGRPGALDASGFLTSVDLAGGVLVVRFSDQARARTVTLSARPGGVWTGDMVGAAGRQAVVMARF